jgi:hypothetical protein
VLLENKFYTNDIDTSEIKTFVRKINLKRTIKNIFNKNITFLLPECCMEFWQYK